MKTINRKTENTKVRDSLMNSSAQCCRLKPCFLRVNGLILCVLMIIFMFLSVMPLSAFAAEDNTKLIAFTFDDGPSKNTATLLDGLKSREVPATFFMCGKNGGHGIVNNGQLLERMVQEGHQLANHSYDHPSIARLSGSPVSASFSRVESLLFQYMGGSYIDMVRTPGGVYNATIKNNTQAPVILWSLDTFDWRNRDEEAVYRKIVENAEDGNIVLMHDLYPTSVQGALRAMDSLKAQGFEFVTVSELLRRRGITPQNGASYTEAPSQGHTLPAYSAPVIKAKNDYDAKKTFVVLSTVDEGISLYYTTDGTYPTLASQQYTEPFLLEENTTFTVVGYDKYGTRTPVAVKKVKKNQVALPEAKSEKGKIAISCETPEAELYYTMDGSKPTKESKKYTKPFSCKGNTLKIIGIRNHFKDSEVASYAVTDNNIVFSDLDPSLWYFPSVNKIVKEGLMQETKDQCFEPQERVTRAMMAQILYNLEGKPKLTEKQSEDKLENSSVSAESESPDGNPTGQFSDIEDSDWYADAVRWASSEGIVNGYSEELFGPQNYITREQIVTILYRYTKEYKQKKVSGSIDLSDYPDGNLVEEYAGEPFAWAIDNEIITGYSDGTLNPLAFTTRAEVAVTLERYIKKYDRHGILGRIDSFYQKHIRSKYVGFFERRGISL